MLTGVDLVHVPYKGNYTTDLIGGQIPLAVAPMAQVIEFIRDGRLRAIAVTTATRSDALPDVPAISEFVPGYEAVGWYGITAPAGTPADVVAKLAAAIVAAGGDATFKSRLVALGVEFDADDHGAIQANSSPTKSTNGPRWSNSRPSRPIESHARSDRRAVRRR